MIITKKEERPLDPVYQDAESAHAGRRGVIMQAAVNTGAHRSFGEVLCWYMEHGAVERPIPASPRAIGKSFYVDASERTVQRANAHWKRLGVLTFEARAGENGESLPPWASLNWRSVVELACVQSAGSVRRVSTKGRRAADGHRETADRDGHFLLAEGVTAVSPSPGDMTPSPGDMTPSPGDMTPGDTGAILPILRNPIPVLACARSFCLLSSVCTVVDDDRCERVVTFAEILALTEEARQPFRRAAWSRQPGAFEAFTAGSVLALTLFSRPWLLAATNGTLVAMASKDPPTDPMRYWLGCLRYGLVERENFPKWPNREEAASYFSQLMRPAEEVARAVISTLPPPDPNPPPPPPEPPWEPPSGPPDPEASKAWREKLERRREAQNRRNREDPQ